MKRNKKKIWITALSVAAVTGITMGIVLPLTMKSEPINSVRNSGIANKINLTTSDLEKVVLPKVEVTNITSTGYDYKIKNWDKPYLKNVSLFTFAGIDGSVSVETKIMENGVVSSNKLSGRVIFPEDNTNSQLWQVQLGGWEIADSMTNSFYYDYFVIDTSTNKNWDGWTWRISKETILSDTSIMWLPEGAKWKSMNIAFKLETKTYSIGDKKTNSNVSYYVPTSPFSPTGVNATRISENELNINLSQTYRNRISMDGADYKEGGADIYEIDENNDLVNDVLLSSYTTDGVQIDPVSDYTMNVNGLGTSLFLSEYLSSRFNSTKTFEGKIGYYDLNSIA